jgi:hypothetical protein
MKSCRLFSFRAASLAGLASGAALAFSSPAVGQLNSLGYSPAAVGFEIGTTGIGPFAEYAFSPQFTATVSYGWLHSDYHVWGRAARYEGKVDLSNAAAIANWYPRAGLFHVSAGLFVSDNRMKLTTKPRANAVYTIGNGTYTAAEVGNYVGKVDFGHDVAPFVGVGWSTNPARRGWGFTSTVGLLFSGSPKASFSVTGPIASDPSFQADLARETRDVNDDIDYSVYPVAKAGVIYRF